MKDGSRESRYGTGLLPLACRRASSLGSSCLSLCCLQNLPGYLCLHLRHCSPSVPGHQSLSCCPTPQPPIPRQEKKTRGLTVRVSVPLSDPVSQSRRGEGKGGKALERESLVWATCLPRERWSLCFHTVGGCPHLCSSHSGVNPNWHPLGHTQPSLCLPASRSPWEAGTPKSQGWEARLSTTHEATSTHPGMGT